MTAKGDYAVMPSDRLYRSFLQQNTKRSPTKVLRLRTSKQTEAATQLMGAGSQLTGAAT